MRVSSFSAKCLAAALAAAAAPKTVDANAALAALDKAILTDILEQYGTYESSTCAAPAGETSFDFVFPGTRAESKWYPDFIPYEQGLFHVEMTHTDGTTSDRSWSIRIGTGGNIYSHFTHEMWGETWPPQNHPESGPSKAAPWIDEVQQTVSVPTALNGNQDCFVHQAGAYQTTADPNTATPFFSPPLASHCLDNSCLVASWGTHAHVPTRFSSPIIYINRYTNCGNGVLQHDQMIHNFADPNNPSNIADFATKTDHNYFNVGWGGVRTSHLPYALEPGARSTAPDVTIDTSTLAFSDPNTVDYVDICRWGYDDPNKSTTHDDTDPPNWPGQRTNLNKLGGYTTFATSELGVTHRANHPIPDPSPITLPCRTSSAACDDSSCMVSSCTDAQVSDDGYVRLRLRVLAGETPVCSRHNAGNYNSNGLIALQCTGMRNTDFYHFAATLFGMFDKTMCAPWVKLGFHNPNNGKTLTVEFVRHWTRHGNDRLYFSVAASDLADAQSQVNDVFDNSAGSTDVEIEFKPVVTPPAADPSAVNAFTFVYGQNQGNNDYDAGNLGGSSRRRLGHSTGQGVGTRDYTIFTINWQGEKLQAGSTYTNRGYYFNSNLGDVEATAESLLPGTYADEIGPSDWSGRQIDVYTSTSGTHIAVVAAADAGGTSTACSTLTPSCSGKSTPGPSLVPFFYITCGTDTYFGPDPYYFTDFAGSFPDHKSTNEVLRSYVCTDSSAQEHRPTWKLLGFFPKIAGCTGLATKTYDETTFVCSTQPVTATAAPTKSPTASPTKNPTESPTKSPTESPTESPTPESPTTESPTTSPTPKPTESPTKDPTPQPTKNPTVKPTLSEATITAVLEDASVSAGAEEFTIGFDGTVAIDGVNCGTDPDVTDFQEALCDQLCEEAGAGNLPCSCVITFIELDCSRRMLSWLQGRSLQATGSMLFEFTLLISAFCDANGGCDADDVETIVQAVSQTVDDNLQTALADSTSGSQFVNALKLEADTNPDLQNAFDAAATSGAFTLEASQTVEEIVLSVLLLLATEWYPAWHHSGSKHTCLNDGNAPLYMKRTKSFIKDSLEDCCKSYYSWEYIPCMLEGGASKDKYVTNEFYAVYEADSCKQSCFEGTEGLNCGGLAKGWDETFETAEECCGKFFWVEQSTCIAASTGTEIDVADLGSDKYYVNWKDFKCAKDCVKNSGNGDDCGGLAKRWDEKYDSKSECCSKRLSWKDQDECNE